MARRRQSRTGRLVGGLAAGAYRASHTVPAVGFLFAALLGVAWWKLRTSSHPAVQWLALGLGIVAALGIAAIAGR